MGFFMSSTGTSASSWKWLWFYRFHQVFFWKRVMKTYPITDPWNWYIIPLQLDDLYGFHVGKYTVHGSYGYGG